QGRKDRAACCTAHIKIIDFDQPVSNSDSLYRWPLIFQRHAGDEISFLSIACLKSYPNLVQIITVNLTLAFEVNCPPRKIERHPKILQHIAADPSDHRLRRLLRIPIKEIAMNNLFAWPWRNRRRGPLDFNRADLLEQQRSESNFRDADDDCARF